MLLKSEILAIRNFEVDHFREKQFVAAIRVKTVNDLTPVHSIPCKPPALYLASAKLRLSYKLFMEFKLSL